MMTSSERLPLAGVPMPDEWADQGLCRGVDPNLFFPSRGETLRPAKQVCAGCPVQTECLTYALAAGPMLRGIWGGTSPDERERIRRRALNSDRASA